MAVSTGQVSVGTTATQLFTTGPAPIERAIVSSSAAAFIGGSGVTTSTGLPVPANTLVEVPLTGAEDDAVYAVVSSSTATVSYFFVA